MAKSVKNKLLECAVVAALASAPAVSYAGAMAGGSTEVTQILNNVQLLMQTVQQEMEYATQLEQYYTQLKQVESAGLQSFSGYVGDAARMYAKAQQLNQTASQFYGSLQSLNTLTEQRYSEFAASGLTWEGYVARLQRMNEVRGQTRKVLTGQEVATMERVQHNWERLREVSAEIPASQGEHSAMQIMNGQMAILNGTMNEMLAFNAAQSRANSERTIIQDVKTEKEDATNAQLGRVLGKQFETSNDALGYWLQIGAKK